MSGLIAGRYELGRKIGAGGMGHVFEAVDAQTGQIVAAKILISGEELDPKALLRFQQEGAILSTLKHPNIVEVYGTFLEEQTSCIIMERLEGQSLGQISHEQRLPLQRIKHLMLQVTEALAYAHSRGIIHRDVKPENIMVLSGDHVKVTDFGIARVLDESLALTGGTTGLGLGTPLYVSPEQVEGHRVDGRSDIYSCGVVLYELVTGRLPFEGEDALTIAFKHVHKAPPTPSEVSADVPEDWEAVILKALSKNPADRYQTASGLTEAVASLGTESRARQVQSGSFAAPDKMEERLEPETRALLEQAAKKERSGDLDGALRAYRSGLTVAPHGPLRDEMEAGMQRVMARLEEGKEPSQGVERAPEPSARRPMVRVGIGAGVAALIVAAAGASVTAKLLPSRVSHPTAVPTQVAFKTSVPRQYLKYRTLVLHLKDLPGGFVQSVGQFITNAQAAAETHTTVARLQSLGRVVAYETRFTRPGHTSVTSLDDVVAVYRGDPSAHAAYLRVIRATRRSKPTYSAFVPAGLGGERTGFLSTQQTADGPATTVIIYFRRGRYRVEVTAAGYGATSVRGESIRLARVIDRRVDDLIGRVVPPTPLLLGAPNPAAAPTGSPAGSSGSSGSAGNLGPVATPGQGSTTLSTPTSPSAPTSLSTPTSPSAPTSPCNSVSC